VYLDSKPVLLAVDDDPQVLGALERDLWQQYDNRFRIRQADSGQKGLEFIKKLKLRNGLAALFLVDQSIPLMTGVEFLQHTVNIFPEAKRVLLTTYEDTDAIITEKLIITWRNHGNRLKNIFIQFSTTCLTIGGLHSNPPLKELRL
jgi:response regulator RpfG family c-di-GMP phosphodiesterase